MAKTARITVRRKSRKRPILLTLNRRRNRSKKRGGKRLTCGDVFRAALVSGSTKHLKAYPRFLFFLCRILFARRKYKAVFDGLDHRDATLTRTELQNLKAAESVLKSNMHKLSGPVRNLLTEIVNDPGSPSTAEKVQRFRTVMTVADKEIFDEVERSLPTRLSRVDQQLTRFANKHNLSPISLGVNFFDTARRTIKGL